MKQFLIIVATFLFTQGAVATENASTGCIFDQFGFVSESGCLVWDYENWPGNVPPRTVNTFPVWSD